MGAGKPGALRLSLGARRRAERRAPRRGRQRAPASAGEGGARARVGRGLQVRLEAGARLSLAPLEREAGARAPLAAPELSGPASPPT